MRPTYGVDELLSDLLGLALEPEPRDSDQKVSRNVLARLARLYTLVRLLQRDLERFGEEGGSRELEGVQSGQLGRSVRREGRKRRQSGGHVSVG